MLLWIGQQNTLGSNQLRLWQLRIFAGIVALPLGKELAATLPTPMVLGVALYYMLLGIFSFNGFRRCGPISTKNKPAKQNLIDHRVNIGKPAH